MVVRAAGGASLHWSQPILHHSSSPSQSFASSISTPSLKRRCRSDGALVCRYVRRLERSALFGTQPTGLHRSRSCEFLKSKSNTLRRVCSASLDAFSDEEFSKEIQELALRFQLSDDNENNNGSNAEGDGGDGASQSQEESLESNSSGVNNFAEKEESSWRETPDWSDRGEEIIPASIERKANSVDVPLSRRMIQKKLQLQDGFREAGESAYCSVKKAFSSMVFIIRELHSYTLQMRGLLLYEDLQGILVRVQKEIHASFVWLFQQVFSHTPTLMVYVMILLANFSVYSMGNTAIAVPSPPASYGSVVEIQNQNHQKFDSSTMKTFTVSSTKGNGKTTSIGGSNGGGGKFRPVASGTDGDGGFERTDQFRTIIPAGASKLSSYGTTREAESTSEQIISEEEMSLWNSIVDEASKMQLRDEALEPETIKRLISPLRVKIEPDDFADYSRTELVYQAALLEEPNSPLLLANYAQFLFLVSHDYDRAEEYFKRATEVEPADAEAYSKYANFLWRIKKDLWAAEETFQEAISADPTNSYYAANYAHFLWNTGGEDTCFPLDAPEEA
ncbi:hypothetical protein SLEP1_g35529 [Rubroshorea leprosula]|uniref:Tetratricopeptide repeat-like superfamily protein n=1 Tax=Rubroshorea leprosula TaxID=152421 RepID=A0AAV5KNZ8_9ROSI|nr:hypothetical protein SLEP1_g35529 [Rubroshorea leprosula]